MRQLITPSHEQWLRRSGPIPPPLRHEYVTYLAQELQMSPQQRVAISNLVHESQERVRTLYDFIGPDLREEIRLTREEIRALLTPEQQRKFDELPRKLPRRTDRTERREGAKRDGAGPRWAN